MLRASLHPHYPGRSCLRGAAIHCCRTYVQRVIAWSSRNAKVQPCRVSKILSPHLSYHLYGEQHFDLYDVLRRDELEKDLPSRPNRDRCVPRLDLYCYGRVRTGPTTGRGGPSKTKGSEASLLGESPAGPLVTMNATYSLFTFVPSIGLTGVLS